MTAGGSRFGVSGEALPTDIRSHASCQERLDPNRISFRCNSFPELLVGFVQRTSEI